MNLPKNVNTDLTAKKGLWKKKSLVNALVLCLIIGSLIIIPTGINAIVPPDASDNITRYNTTEDSYVYSQATSTNYGSDLTLNVYGESTSWHDEVYLKFPLETTDKVLLSADLWLYYSSSIGEVELNVNLILGNWSENAITYANKPSNASLTVTSKALDTNGVWVKINVTSLYNEWYENPTNYYGYHIIRTYKAGDGSNHHINSKEANSNVPTLALTYKPLVYPGFTNDPPLTCGLTSLYSYSPTTNMADVTFTKITAPSGFLMNETTIYGYFPANGTYTFNISAYSTGNMSTTYLEWNVFVSLGTVDDDEPTDGEWTINKVFTWVFLLVLLVILTFVGLRYNMVMIIAGLAYIVVSALIISPLNNEISLITLALGIFFAFTGVFRYAR